VLETPKRAEAIPRPFRGFMSEYDGKAME